ncbi:hypothetical protein SAMN05444392_11615 [Seinonella peptonophila]|uniref:Uncharacterized protein n=2 Tax=Seinonella peptonophila TaxID=112248 RepID=A0A1M5AV82_9BACL|nr:hypothetical protein SAMN05444392_11615 [Seinonella peptonophila]
MKHQEIGIGHRGIVDQKNSKVIQFDQASVFAEYCKVISDTFCPFLKPAEKANVLFATEYKVNADDLAGIQETMFYYGVMHVEALRRFRYQNRNSSKGILACDNVIFVLDDKFHGIDGQALFSWPHWLLKVLYSQVGVMIGKFWIGEKINGRNGLAIPEPPCHFFSIRSVIKERDPYFFTKAPQLLSQIIQSTDSLANVHKSLLPNGCNLDFASMMKHDYYQIVLEWGRKEWEKKGTKA